MQLDGEVTIATDRESLWQIVSDPEILVLCVPGAEEVEMINERQYRGTIKRGIANINLALEGEVELIELAPPDQMVAEAKGEDDRTGSIMTADAEMELSDIDEETMLTYVMDVQFTGRLASIGSRIMKRKIKSDIDTFFDNIRERAEE
jgi:carbon monoxide dehydrogenase subunit G